MTSILYFTVNADYVQYMLYGDGHPQLTALVIAIGSYMNDLSLTISMRVDGYYLTMVT